MRKEKEEIIDKRPYLCMRNIVGEAYIYYYQNYKGVSKKYWYWIKLSTDYYRDEIAEIINETEECLIVKFHSTPCPGGRAIEIKIPKQFIYYYNEVRPKVEKRKNKKYEDFYSESLPIQKMDIRKVIQYGEETDMYFGLIVEEIP